MPALDDPVRAGPRLARGPHDPGQPGPEDPVRAGLRLYRFGLMLIVVAALAGHGLVLFTTLVLRSVFGLRALTTAMSAAWGAAAVLMAIGLWRVRAGAVAGARWAATAGLALQVPAALAELALLALGLAHVQQPYFASHQLLVQSGWLLAASQAPGLGSAVCVVLAMRHLHQTAAARGGAGRVLKLLVALLSLVVTLRGVLVCGLRIPGWPVPLLAVAALLLCAPALLLHLRLIRVVLEALPGAGAPSSKDGVARPVTAPPPGHADPKTRR